MTIGPVDTAHAFVRYYLFGGKGKIAERDGRPTDRGSHADSRLRLEIRDFIQ